MCIRDSFTGVGGYHFPGQTYGESTHEQRLSCVDCHMVPVADNSSVPDHSFNPNLSACLSCHATATTFDVNGFESDVKAALTQIETWFNAQGLLTRATATPYIPLTPTQLGDGNWAEDMPVPGSGTDGGLLTQNQAGALYDYILVARGGAYGVHNPKSVSYTHLDVYKRQILTKAGGLRHVWLYLTEYRNTPVEESKKTIKLREPAEMNDNCMLCHSTEATLWLKVPDHRASLVDTRAGRIGCASEGCHGLAHPFFQPPSSAGDKR